MSFAFSIPDPVKGQRINWDVAPPLRELLDVTLREVSVVSLPAYPDTTVSLRAAVALRSMAAVREHPRPSVDLLMRQLQLEAIDNELDADRSRSRSLDTGDGWTVIPTDDDRDLDRVAREIWAHGFRLPWPPGWSIRFAELSGAYRDHAALTLFAPYRLVLIDLDTYRRRGDADLETSLHHELTHVAHGSRVEHDDPRFSGHARGPVGACPPRGTRVEASLSVNVFQISYARELRACGRDPLNLLGDLAAWPLGCVSDHQQDAANFL